MLSLSYSLETTLTADEKRSCPFSETESNICSASLSSMVIGTNSRKAYCSNENYDSCPIFLAKLLRKSK